MPTPTVAPPAQGAVDAYVTMLNLYNAATTDPEHADIAEINKYLTGKALSITDHSLTSMAKAGYAYRGTPAAPRVAVGSVVSDTFVFLTSCPLASTTDPFVQYNIKTGKPVATANHTKPGPYLLTLPVRKFGAHWKVTDIVQDTSRTCRG